MSTNLKTNEIRRKQKSELDASISEVEGDQKKVVSKKLNLALTCTNMTVHLLFISRSWLSLQLSAFEVI